MTAGSATDQEPAADAAMTSLARVLPAATTRLVREGLDALVRDEGFVIAIHSHITRIRRERLAPSLRTWA